MEQEHIKSTWKWFVLALVNVEWYYILLTVITFSIDSARGEIIPHWFIVSRNNFCMDSVKLSAVTILSLKQCKERGWPSIRWIFKMFFKPYSPHAESTRNFVKIRLSQRGITSFPLRLSQHGKVNAEILKFKNTSAQDSFCPKIPCSCLPRHHIVGWIILKNDENFWFLI